VHHIPFAGAPRALVMIGTTVLVQLLARVKHTFQAACCPLQGDVRVPKDECCTWWQLAWLVRGVRRSTGVPIHEDEMFHSAAELPGVRQAAWKCPQMFGMPLHVTPSHIHKRMPLTTRPHRPRPKSPRKPPKVTKKSRNRLPNNEALGRSACHYTCARAISASKCP
jgi:hypothetical protein